MFLTLARPVREWAGHHWSHYLIAAVIVAIVGIGIAVGLWPGASDRGGLE